MTTLHATTRGSATGALDPIGTEVLRNRLISSAEQMKVILQRTSFSPILFEGLDFACALYDRQVRLLAQARTLPLFLGTMNFAIEASVEAVGGEQALRPGDVLFNSYGYHVGSHSQDAALIVPAFLDADLIGYAVTKAHLADLGAKSPWAGDSTDNFQEGVIFPGVKLYAAGKRQDVMRVVLANSRMPRDVEGDLSAQMSAAHAGASALCELVTRYGLADFDAHVERILDHGEAMARQRILAIEDGSYQAMGSLDGADPTDPTRDVTAGVRIAGDSIVVEVAECPPEQPTAVNCPLAATVSVCRFAVLSALIGDQAVNEGHLRAMEVRVPPVSMYDPRPPAPIFMYFSAASLLMDIVHRALAGADRSAVPAGSGGDICGVMWWGYDETGQIWTGGNDHLCGQGARAHGDGGAPLMHISCAGGRTGSSEVFESKFPIKVVNVELAADSGGVGTYAGGTGVTATYQMKTSAYMTAFTERTVRAPWGLEGGGDAQPNRITIQHPDGSVEDVSKASDKKLALGTLVTVQTGGGGGFGDPAGRSADAVHADVRDGYLTEARAHEHYPHAYQ